MSKAWLTAAVVAWSTAAGILPVAASPLTAENPAAGPGSVTLLVYDALARPFSLMDLRAVVARLLTRVNTRVVTKSAQEVRPDDLRSADYLVWLGTDRRPSDARLGWVEAGKPVLVCGMPPYEAAAWPGVNGFRKFPPLAESWRSARFSIGPAVLNSPASFVLPAAVKEGESRLLASIAGPARSDSLAWQNTNTFWFAALPLEQAVGVALSGILPEFYGISPGPSAVLLTLEDFHLGCDPGTLRRAADYLAQKNIPFAVTVRMPSADANATQVSEFVTALRYAQGRQGRVFLIPGAGKFWDSKTDQPPSAEDMDAAGNAAEADVALCLENGVIPLGVRLPDSGVSIDAAARVARSFDFGIGAVLPSEATATATFIPATITRVAGRLLLVPPGSALGEDNSAAADFARNLLLVPGSILNVPVPAWLPFEKMSPLLDQAAGLQAQFLDPGEAAASISTPGGAMWTAPSGAPKPDFSGRAMLRTYDFNAQLLSEKEVTADAAAVVESPAEARFFTLLPWKP
jgi:hypothetical protein